MSLTPAPPADAVLRTAGADRPVAAPDTVHAGEVGHVGCGAIWVRRRCGRRKLDPEGTVHALVRRDFPGGLKPPINAAKRAEAGVPPDFCRPLAGLPDAGGIGGFPRTPQPGRMV